MEIHLHSCLCFSVVVICFWGYTFGDPKPGTLGYNMIYPNAVASIFASPKNWFVFIPNLFNSVHYLSIWLALSCVFKSAMLHGSILHLFFSIRKNNGKLPDSYRNHPVLGGYANPPWNRRPPHRKSEESKGGRSRKVRWFHRSAAWGGVCSRPRSWRSWKKKWEGVLEIVVLWIFHEILCIILMMIWYMGGKSYGKWCEREVLNLTLQ